MVSKSGIPQRAPRGCLTARRVVVPTGPTGMPLVQRRTGPGRPRINQGETHKAVRTARTQLGGAAVPGHAEMLRPAPARAWWQAPGQVHGLGARVRQQGEELLKLVQKRKSAEAAAEARRAGSSRLRGPSGSPSRCAATLRPLRDRDH